MTYTYVNFRWSTNGNHDWVIDRNDFINGRYTYYHEGVPIRMIGTPFMVGYGYMAIIGLCDEMFTSRSINVSEIKDISEVREIKLKEIGI